MARRAANTSRRTGLTEPPHRMGCRADTRPSKRLQPQQSPGVAEVLQRERTLARDRNADLPFFISERPKYNCVAWTAAENQREQAKAAWRFPREAGT